jgi:hypothetical protein
VAGPGCGGRTPQSLSLVNRNFFRQRTASPTSPPTPRALRPAVSRGGEAWPEQRGRREAQQGQVTATPLLLRIVGNDRGREYGAYGLILVDHNHFLVLLVPYYILLQHILLF